MPSKILSTVTETVKKLMPKSSPKQPAHRERTGGYWPDDDLAELEADYRPSWIDRKKTKGWLKR